MILTFSRHYLNVYERACPGCHQPFTTDNVRQRKCRSECGRVRVRRGRYVRVTHRFVAVDGEGVTLPNGEHRYVLLSVGDHSLKASDLIVFDEHDEYLSFDDICCFLWDCSRADPDAVYVGFYLGYDFAQWLRTLPEERARMLLSAEGRAKRIRRQTSNPTPFPVRYAGWEFDILPHRRFKVRPEGSKEPWLFVCDAGSFFQTSFLRAIDPEKWETPILSDDEWRTILAGKERRATASLDDDMIRYNVTENVVMSRLMQRYDEGLRAIGVHLNRGRYFGPGQAASAWLESSGCVDAATFRENTPEPVRTAARASFYGGWFEIRRHGHVAGTSYTYDINSAYPAEIATLPCLEHAHWSNDDAEDALVLCYATVAGSGSYGPMPYRTSDARILRPQRVRGWYWRHELEAAYAAGLIDDVEIDARWSLRVDCDCPPPLTEVRSLYENRRAMGKDSAAGRAAKLVYNSLYGKFAQSIGQPRWANPVYASLITAGCRVRILDALATHPDGAAACSMVATDSVTFDTPHPGLTISDELGDWSAKQSHDLLLFAPGIYWDDSTRERIADGRSVTLKSRGVRASDLAAMVAEIDWRFRLWEPRQPWPTFTIPVQFAMVSCEQALAWGKWHLAGSVRQNVTRKLSADPHDKRASVFKDARGFYTIPFPRWDTLDSAPYTRAMGEDYEKRQGNSPYGPDGSVDALFAEALHG